MCIEISKLDYPEHQNGVNFPWWWLVFVLKFTFFLTRFRWCLIRNAFSQIVGSGSKGLQPIMVFLVIIVWWLVRSQRNLCNLFSSKTRLLVLNIFSYFLFKTLKYHWINSWFKFTFAWTWFSIRPGNASESETAESDKTFKAFMTAVKLCIPYSSNIGGTGTLIGSPSQHSNAKFS